MRTKQQMVEAAASLAKKAEDYGELIAAIDALKRDLATKEGELKTVQKTLTTGERALIQAFSKE